MTQDNSAPAPPKTTILVVDDNPDNLRLLVSILSAHDYRVCVAVNGVRALEAVAADPPELILLDVQMPEMDGYEVCRRLKADSETQSIPVVFVSAGVGSFNLVRAFECGACDYLPKPIQERELLARVANHLKTRELQRQLEELNETLEAKVNQRTKSLQRNNELLREKNEFLFLLQEVSFATSRSSQLEFAIRDVVELVCIHTKWSVGHVYLPGLGDDKHLQSTGLLYRDDQNAYET